MRTGNKKTARVGGGCCARLRAGASSVQFALGGFGMGRMQQVRHVTLPGLAPTIVLVSTLSLSNVLNAGFDQIYNMYNPLIYETVDIIDTFTYRLGLVDLQFSLSTAVGLFKSVVSFLLISLSYFLAYKTTGYRIY